MGGLRTVGRADADMSAIVSAQLPFFCAFHFFYSVEFLTRILWDAVLFGRGWLRLSTEEEAPSFM